MPHKCTKCGREYKDGSTEILKGCASCGGKKFLYIKEAEINKDVLEEKSIDEIADETHEEVLEIVGPKVKKEVEMYDRVETIRIVSRLLRDQPREDGADRRADRERGERGFVYHRSDVDGKGRAEEEAPGRSKGLFTFF